MKNLILILIFFSTSIFAEVVNRQNIDYEKRYKKFTIDEIVSNTANLMAKNIPQQLDYVTTIIKVSAFGNRLTISKQIDTEHKDFKDIWQKSKNEVNKKSYEQDRDLFCNHAEYKYLISKRNLILSYKYYDSNMKSIFEYNISKKECGEYKSAKIKKEKTIYDRIMEDREWVQNLSKEEQEIALLIMYKDLEKDVFGVIMPNAKKKEDNLWGFKVFSYGLDSLAESSTKSSELKSIFTNFNKQLVSLIRGEITPENFQKNNKKTFVNLQNVQSKISKKSVLLFFSKNEESLKDASDSIIVYAKFAASSPVKK